MRRRGAFITFEGSEGCGKSTQSRLLYRFLKKRGLPAAYLREPGGTFIGEKIRKILLNPKNHICPQAEALLYMAARAEAVDKAIRSALSKKQIVVCDRFLDSTLAYQGYGLGISLGFIRSLGAFACGGIKPHLTILLDIPVKKGLRHRAGAKDRIERRSLQYHQRVRKGYLKLASLNPQRIKIVKVAPDKKKTQEKIRKLVLAKLCHSAA
jgi:dTMP kinase